MAAALSACCAHCPAQGRSVTRNEQPLQSGRLFLDVAPGVDPEAIRAALQEPGVVVKQSRRTAVRRVGDWCIKESSGNGWLHPLDLTLRPGRYTSGWIVGRTLHANGIPVPRPVSNASQWRGPICVYRATVTEWLEGWTDVEEAARMLAASAAEDEAIREFLGGIDTLHGKLCDARYYHADLSGKNIFCRRPPGAEHFECCLIDLDSVRRVRSVSTRLRIRNAVQLYDSFCDLWDERLLGSMVCRVMGLSRFDADTFEQVRSIQQVRRARIEAVWARQGKAARKR